MTKKELDIVLSALWFAQFKAGNEGERQKYLKVFKKLEKTQDAVEAGI